MRIRWRSGVCGLSVTALALAGAGLAGAAGGGSYRGSTSQRQPVSLTVSSGAVRNFKIRILDKCPDGHILRVRAGFTSPMAITNGKFGGKFHPAGGHRGEKATLAGVVSGARVTGSFSDVGYSSREHRLCHGSARFTARHL